MVCSASGAVFRLGLVVAISLTPQQGWAWGQKAHQAINRMAVGMMINQPAKRLFHNHLERVAFMGSVPDVRWKSIPESEQEKPLHYFQMDRYQASQLAPFLGDYMFGQARQLLGEAFVRENGMAVWRITTLYERMVAAVKAKNWVQTMQLAGVMGHYVGDITQPMHLTSDYDGQSIGRKGIHRFYETTLVDRMDARTLSEGMIRTGGQYRSDLERSSDYHGVDVKAVLALANNEGEVSFDELPVTLDHFDRSGQNDQELMAQIVPRVGHASAVLAKIWDSAFTAAGSVGNIPATTVTVPDPAWVPFH